MTSAPAVGGQAPAADASAVADHDIALGRARLSSVSIGQIVAFRDGHFWNHVGSSVTDPSGMRLGLLPLPPSGVRIAGPMDVGRQGRIMRALRAHGVPVPHVLACDGAPAVVGRAYLAMELVREPSPSNPTRARIPWGLQPTPTRLRTRLRVDGYDYARDAPAFAFRIASRHPCRPVSGGFETTAR